MAQTTDRSIRDNRVLLGLVLGVGALAVVSALFFWARGKTPEPARGRDDQGAQQLIQPAFRNEPLTVTFYYPLGGSLAAASAPAKRQPELQAQAREALLALFQDQRAVQAAVLRDVKLRAFYLDGQGTAYIDVASGQEQTIRASAWDELLALYAMVNTLSRNFEEIKQVVFLVDGRDAQTLAGHLDLSRAYTSRMDLVRQ